MRAPVPGVRNAGSALACVSVVAVRSARLVLVAAACLAVLSACGSDITSSPSNSAATTTSGPQLPDVLLTDLDGQPVRLESLTGTPLVINYWYASCPPCREEMPAFASVATEFAGQVRFVGINPQDSAAQARAVAAERGVTFEQLLDPTQRSVDALALTGFPSTVLVRADGTIAETVRRALTADELRTMIRSGLVN